MTRASSSSSARCARPSRPTPGPRASARGGRSSPRTRRRARGGASGGPRRSSGPRWPRCSRRWSSRSATAAPRRRSSGSCATSCASRSRAAPAPAAQLPGAGRLLVERRERPVRPQRRRARSRSATTTTRPGRRAGSSSARPTAARSSRSTRATGARRWRVEPGGTVSVPRWAPDGLHIAYRAGGVAADRLRQRRARRARGRRHGRRRSRLAPGHAAHRRVGERPRHGDRRGRRHRQGPAQLPQRRAVSHLAWSADGRKLLIAGRRHGTIHDYVTGSAQPASRSTATCSPPPTAHAASPSPSTRGDRHRDPPARHRSCSAPKAASTTSSGRRTAAGCWRVTLRAGSGCWRGPPGQASVSSVGGSAREHGPTDGAASGARSSGRRSRSASCRPCRWRRCRRRACGPSATWRP